MLIIRLILIIVFIVLGISVYAFMRPTNPASKLVNDIRTKAAVPTPFEYEEITVPFLRTKAFKSTLIKGEEVGNNASYASYLSHYQSDALRINALLTEPKGEMPMGGWPAIVFVHGYIPPAQYSTNGAPYAAYVDYLARNGFVVLKIDLRGHGDSEGSPGGGYYGSDYVTDALNAYSALQTYSNVNPRRIGMWGHSMAGNILLRSIAIKKDIPAAVMWAGAVYSYEDRIKYGIQDNSYQPSQADPTRRAERQRISDKYGEFDPASPFWKQVAPTNYLNEISTAIQLDHAVDDPVVNVGYSRDLDALLDKTNLDHQLNEYPSGGHNISGANFNTAMQNTVDWFNKHLEE